MTRGLDLRQILRTVGDLLWLTLLVAPVGILAGSASAFFLWALEEVTRLRWENPWLLFLLPVAGALVVFVYQRFGKNSGAGTNLLIDEIHEPGGGVPRRMAPLVLFGTLATHLCGGSAGREGTAVQMGGSLASFTARLFRLSPETQRVLLMAGVSAGFGSVFGTPLAGTIFAMEVLAVGRISYHALLPILAASLIGDATCSLWGIAHTPYHINFSDTAAVSHFHLEPWLLLKVLGASVAFGLASRVFANSTHGLQHLYERYVKTTWLRPVIGGVIVIALTFLLGRRDYLGLGVHSPDPHAVTILSAFQPGGADTWSWFWKLLFTVVTLSAGFKGGEVTPLFFIGATLGHTLAVLTGAPIDLMAGLGFIAVFAGAANTPLACTVMGAELFGGHHLLYFAVACFVAYYFSGTSTIYRSQRVAVAKVQISER